MLIDEEPLGQVKSVRLFKVTLLNLHKIVIAHHLFFLCVWGCDFLYKL